MKTKTSSVKKKMQFVPKLNADLELKQLGTIMGLPIYIDMSKQPIDEEKFQQYLIAQKMLADFFNPPKTKPPKTLLEESEDGDV